MRGKHYRKHYRKKSIAESIIEKKNSSADYVKITELHAIHMTSHVIWVDEIMGVMIAIHKINKNLNILKK